MLNGNPVISSNPILDELDALSPQAKQALQMAHANVTAAGVPPDAAGQKPQNLQPQTRPMSAAGQSPVPSLTPPPSFPEPRGTGGLPDTVSRPISTPPPFVSDHQRELNRLTAPATPGMHDNTQTGLSGIAQIHSPWARIPLQLADAVGGGLFPGIAMGIPGTQLHHGVLVRQAQNAVNSDDVQLQNEAKLRQDQALTDEADARADALRNPPAKEQDPEKDAYAYYTKVQGLTPGDAYAKILGLKTGNKPDKEETPEIQAYNALLKKGLTPEDAYAQVKQLGQTEKPDTSAQDDQEYEGLIAKQLIGKPLTPEEKAKKSAYEKRKTLGIATTNFYSNEREAGKQDIATRQGSYKAFSPALDSAERFNVMTKNYEDAVRDHNQQAMLSLLANHLGMTMGLQKGARMTKDIVQEAQQSRPWLQGIEAKFDKAGYLQGVTLTPEQMRQMVGLGRERFAEDLTKARSEAKYLGSEDDGPERKPNASTINFYIGLARGDAAQAKQLAAEDGWSVK